MAEFFAIVFLILLFVAVGAVVRFFWRIFVGLMRMGTTPANQQQVQVRVVKTDRGMTAEEEGNVHSGPYGYSPNTAYPETQYGSLFNPDAEWNHEEQ